MQSRLDISKLCRLYENLSGTLKVLDRPEETSPNDPCLLVSWSRGEDRLDVFVFASGRVEMERIIDDAYHMGYFTIDPANVEAAYRTIEEFVTPAGVSRRGEENSMLQDAEMLSSRSMVRVLLRRLKAAVFSPFRGK